MTVVTKQSEMIAADKALIEAKTKWRDKVYSSAALKEWDGILFDGDHKEAANKAFAQVDTTKFNLLVVVDVQNDFCTDGGLAVPDAEHKIPFINELQELFTDSGGDVILTQDWHPANHSSFASNHDGREPFEEIGMQYGAQTLWPDHCIQNTVGADFHPALNQSLARFVIRKGMNPAVDSYSAFKENDKVTTTGLAGCLEGMGVQALYFVGIAGDFCVGWSVLDALEADEPTEHHHGNTYTVSVFEAGVACIDAGEGWSNMKQQIVEAGGTII